MSGSEEGISIKRKTFSRNLRCAVANSYLNQSQIADLCGVSRGSVNDWMKARAFPRPEKLSLLAKALGVTEYDLTVDFHNKIETPNMNREIIEIATELHENPNARRLYAAITRLNQEDMLAISHVVYKLTTTEKRSL